MICHLRRRIFPLILHTPPRLPASQITPPFFPHRAISSTAPTISPKPFAVEDYLVGTCGLTRAKAVKASEKISHLRSPAKPDAVLSYLSDLGLPASDIAAVVAVDPRFLCASVQRTLAPRVAELGGLGLSPPQIARIISFFYNSRCSSLHRTVGFWLEVFGSFNKLLQVLRINHGIASVDIESVVKPNLAFLQQCGLSACKIPRNNSRLFTKNPKSLQEAAERVEELGLERGSRMFCHALAFVAFMSKEDVARKIELFQKIGFSEDQTLVIMRKAPFVLGLSEENIRRTMHFLIRDVGLEAPYIARRPVLLLYSLERRLLPRHWLLKVLREKGLLNIEGDYYRTAAMAERIFLKKFVHPFVDLVPGLADDYASRCSVKVPSGAQEI